MIKVMLEMKGCDVVEAADGKEASACAPGEGFDVTPAGLSLPVIDGYEAAQQILSHRKTRHVIVVAFPARRGADRRQRTLDAGCMECVTEAGLLW